MEHRVVILIKLNFTESPISSDQMANQNNKKVEKDNKDTESNRSRDGWGNHVEFILSCISYSVGLGNVWRFPYLAFKNGGGAFVIPYIISVIITGLPLYFMELSLGQFSNMGPTGIFRNLAPAFQGLGWGMVTVSLLVALYYNMIIAWVLFYFFHSFTSTLPWSHCRNDFNTAACQSKLETDWCIQELNDTEAVFYNKTCYNATMAQLMDVNSTRMNPVSPSDEFFNIFMLQRSSEYEETGSISWKLVLCLAASWLIVFACVFKGVQSSGKVVYFTATFPYVVLFILLIRGATLPGAVDGILFYVQPDLHKLKNWQVWKDAAEQVFFSLSPAFGGLMTMGSYNKFHTNCKRDAILIAFVDSFTSTFAGCAIFSATGFMANELRVPIENVTGSGMSLAFVAYPEAIVRMPVSPLWSILFFFMLFNLGLGSEFAVFETVVTALLDSSPKFRRYRAVVIGLVCLCMFLLGLPFCTQAGIYIFQIFNDYSAGFSVIILALLECIVISYLYGIRRFLGDVGMMLGSPPRYYWIATLSFLTPIYLFFILVASFISLQPSTFDTYVLPPAAQNLGYGLSALSIVWIPIFAIYHIIKRLMRKESLLSLVKPTVDWCPASERSKRRAMKVMANNGNAIWAVTKL